MKLNNQEKQYIKEQYNLFRQGSDEYTFKQYQNKVIKLSEVQE